MAITKTLSDVLAAYQKIKDNAKTQQSIAKEECDKIKQFTSAILDKFVMDSDTFKEKGTANISPIDIGKAIFGQDEWNNMNQFQKNRLMDDVMKKAAKEYADANGITVSFPDLEVGKKRQYTFSKNQPLVVTPAPTEAAPITSEAEVTESTETSTEAINNSSEVAAAS